MNAINESGFRTPTNTGARPPDSAQVSTAEAFLRTPPRTPNVTASNPDSYTLKHEAERWGEVNGLEPYVSTGALLQAARNLDIPIRQRQDASAQHGRVGVSLAARIVTRKAVPRRHGGAEHPRDELVADAALHEAAHLVAACACPGSWINEVEVGTRTRGDRAAGLGRCAATTVYPDEQAFVRLLGWAWEKAHGEPLRGGPDVWEAAVGLKLYPYVLPAAVAFAERYRGTIRRTADEILAEMTVAGLLRGRKLGKIVKRLRGEVESFKRPAGGLTPHVGAERAIARQDWHFEQLEIVRRLVGASCWTYPVGACGACATGNPEGCLTMVR